LALAETIPMAKRLVRYGTRDDVKGKRVEKIAKGER
jgi:hypothetical protein